MALQKEIIVLGDIEMGGGTLTDDFISDNALSELILELSHRPHPVDLILNGDTFDFLKCPYLRYGKPVYVRHITTEVSLTKLDMIRTAHFKVFEAMRKFIHTSQHSVFFIYGNHDLDLLFPAVQQKIREYLGDGRRVHFGVHYQNHEVYVEHGMQYDILNKVDFNKKYLIHHKKEILNLSWVSFGIITQFLKVKEIHPMMERVHNHNFFLRKHKYLLEKLRQLALNYLFKSILYYPWRYLTDPTYTFPRGLFKEFYHRLRKRHWDVDKVVHPFKKARKKTLYQFKVYVLGHVHEHYVEQKRNTLIVHPGSWRDEYDLIGNKMIPRVKQYVQVLVGEVDSEYQIIKYPIKRKTFNFDKVVEDQIKYVRLAAQEEGHILKF